MECAKTNAVYFGGQPVLCLGPDSSILVNTDLMSRGISEQAIVLIPVDNNIQVAKPVASIHGDNKPLVAGRAMEVTVPPGYRPGSHLAVTSPDGGTFDVIVPEGVQAGEKFRVEY
jgi:hypothetical protein